MDKKKIEAAIRMLFEAIGDDPDRPGIKKTPQRYARLCEEVFAGIGNDGAGLLNPLPSENYKELVMVRDITFYSMCEHHLLPFFGKVHIAYLPSKNVAGLSKFARLTEVFSRRPQVQERLTGQIASSIQKHLKPRGVLVVIEAMHLCMSMRGIKKESSRVVTLSARGVFERSDKQAEVMRLLMRSNSQ